MRNEGLLITADNFRPVHEYHGFKLQRHVSNKGTVITFKDWLGAQREMLVLDAAYRNVLAFGTWGKTISTHADMSGPIYEGYVSMDVYLPGKEEMPDLVTDSYINRIFAYHYRNDRTGRLNSSNWMKWSTSTDNSGVKGVPAVEWCRQQSVNGQECDLPNAYETIVIWACGDKLDEMDSTAPSNTDLKLGFTSTGHKTIGRHQKCNNAVSESIWSSTAGSPYCALSAWYPGGLQDTPKNYWRTVVPILELD